MGDADDRALADALVLAAVRLPRVLRALDQAPALSATEASALGVLVHGGAMNIGELARHEQVRPPSMTRTVAQLEARGLVERTPSASDGRAWLIAVTAAGRTLFRDGHRRRIAPLVQWLAALDRGNKAQLLAALPALQAMSMLETPAARPGRRSRR
ncbi:MarR family transcriptional regulator [Thermomonas brevis]